MSRAAVVVRQHRLTRWRVLGGGLLVVFAATGAIWQYGYAQRRHVRVPSPGSLPAEVVTAYVEAEDARDHATIRQFTGPHFRGVLDHVHGSHLREPAVTTTMNLSGGPYVSVDLSVSGGDGSFRGHKSWGYFLSPGGPSGWLITAEGEG